MRMRIRSVLAASLFLVLVFGATGSADYLTDLGVHIPPNYFTMAPPPVGGDYVDGHYGSRSYNQSPGRDRPHRAGPQ